MQIREARLADVDALVRIINDAFQVERFFVDRDRTDDATVRDLLTKGTFLVGEDPPGTMVAAVFLERRGDHGYYGMLSVGSAVKRKGYGRRMIGVVEEFFRRMGCVAVDIRVVNLRAELPPIYRKLGYVEDGTEPFTDSRQLQPAHFIRMTKRLSS